MLNLFQHPTRQLVYLYDGMPKQVRHDFEQRKALFSVRLPHYARDDKSYK